MAKTLAVLIAVFAIMATACGGGAGAPATTAPAGTSAGAAAKTPRPCCTKLVAAYSNISADDWFAWYAFEKGIFKDNGLDVDLQSINGGAQTSAALLANQIQIGQFGGAEALSANAGGADLVLVANLAPVYPYKLYGAKGITTVAGLKGKKVGVSNVGGSSDIGSIDAGVDDPPEDLELVKAGMNVLIDLAGQKLPAANTGVIMDRKFLNANKDTVQAYVDSLTIARAKMKADKAGATAVLGKYFKLTDQAALDGAYDFFMNEVTTAYLYPEVVQFKDAIAILGAGNPNIAKVDITKMIDRTFMQSAQDRKLGG